MGPIDLLFHLFHLMLPGLALGAIGAGLAKLAWWRELKPVRWWRLAAWAGGTSTTVALAGLVVFGRDGRMATYVGMVLAAAVALWWAGFGPARR